MSLTAIVEEMYARKIIHNSCSRMQIKYSDTRVNCSPRDAEQLPSGRNFHSAPSYILQILSDLDWIPINIIAVLCFDIFDFIAILAFIPFENIF